MYISTLFGGACMYSEKCLLEFIIHNIFSVVYGATKKLRKILMYVQKSVQTNIKFG